MTPTHDSVAAATALQGALNFTGKTVFVAGGSSGINFAIADAFARHGAQLAICSRSPERVDAAAERLRQYGGVALGFTADVRDPLAVEQALRLAHEALGPIDVLISGAAGNFLAPAMGMSAKGFRTVVEIDLLGGFHVMRAAQPFLRQPGASILNISAPQAFNPTAFQAHVCAAKAGLDMMVRVLAIEWGAQGIRVNSLVPGPIADTEGIKRLAPDAATQQAMQQSIPLQRMGSVAEVANMALVLSSPLASFVTGAVLPVDGGSSLMGGRDYTAAFAATHKET